MFTRTPLETRNGIPRFVPSDGYVKNWSRQWDLWRGLHNTEEQRAKTREEFIQRFGLDPFDRTLAPLTILDAGCGNGRNSALFNGSQHKVWAIDASHSVDFAIGNVSGTNTTVAQANIDDLPFADGTFDYIFSDGVLIHVPDIAHSIAQLFAKLKPGGTLALAFAKEIDPDYAWAIRRESVINWYRRYTTTMNETALAALVSTLSAIYPLRLLPVVGPQIGLLIPEHHPDPEWRKCYIHDYLSATYRERQNPDRILAILKSIGAEKIELKPGNEVVTRCIRPQ